jgi:osmoprotectant transport system substrate-binding protein
MIPKLASVVLFAGAAFVLSSCGSKPPTVTVGSKTGTEETIVGEIVAAHLQKQMPGIQVERKLALGGTMVVQGALQSGAIDIYAEDIGTLLAGTLKEDVPADPSVALERARLQIQRAFQAKVLEPIGFSHKIVVLSYPEGAAGLKADTLSAMGALGKGIKIAICHELLERKDAFTPLATQYRVTPREFPARMEVQEMYTALQTSTTDLGIGYSTDASVDEPGFRILKDDLGVYAARPVCLIARGNTLAAQPELERILNALKGRITDEAIHRMNKEVDLKHRKAQDVARDFLAAQGL